MEDRFCQSALEQGWITQARLEECKIIQKEMGNMGIQEKIWNVFMDKKYMSMDQCQEILRQLDDAPMGQTATGAHEIPQAPTPSAENTQLPGYEMAGLLGKGAMGSVYKAVQLSLNRTVAIKILPPHFASKPRRIKRMKKEAQTLGRLNHPNIVSAIDFGRHQNIHYLVMEYVEGKSLQEMLKEGKQFEEKEVLTIALPIVNALHHAQKHGIIHRDIKPANIMLDHEDTPKLCDLGLVKVESGEDMTKAGGMLGTPAYMSPEQVKGVTDIDIRTDIYSLGMTMFHLLAGKLPYDTTSEGKLFMEILSDRMTTLEDANVDVSPKVNQLVAKMTAKNRDQRYQTPEELMEELKRLTGQDSGTSLTSFQNLEGQVLQIDDRTLYDIVLQGGMLDRSSLDTCVKMGEKSETSRLWHILVQQKLLKPQDALEVLSHMEKTIDPTKVKARSLFLNVEETVNSPVTFLARPSDLIGQSVGKFEIQRLVGKGGMAYVYEALDPVLERKVAIKILSQILALNTKYRKRFIQEAKVLARLEHPNVINIYDFGEFNDTLYIAFKFIDGPSLEDILKKRKPMASQSLKILHDVCTGLWKVHQQGIVHRDIKPSNIMIDQAEGQAILTDFGIANRNEKEISQSGRSLGTPMYMAPEVFQGQKIDARSDIYSLGVTAYYMLSGQRPFSSEAPYEIIRQHISGDYEPLAKVTQLPKDISQLVEWMMNKDPNQRPADLGQVLEKLNRLKDKGMSSTTLTNLMTYIGEKSSNVGSLGTWMKDGLGKTVTGVINLKKHGPAQKTLIRVALIIVAILTVAVIIKVLVDVKFNSNQTNPIIAEDDTNIPSRKKFLTLLTKIEALRTKSKIQEALNLARNGKAGVHQLFHPQIDSKISALEDLQSQSMEEFKKRDRVALWWLTQGKFNRANLIYDRYSSHDMNEIRKIIQQRRQEILDTKKEHFQQSLKRSQRQLKKREINRAISALIPLLQPDFKDYREAVDSEFNKIFGKAELFSSQLVRKKKFQAALMVYRPFVDENLPRFFKRALRGVKRIFKKHKHATQRFAIKYRNSAIWEKQGEYSDAISVMEALADNPSFQKIVNQRLTSLRQERDRIPNGARVYYGIFSGMLNMVELSNGSKFNYTPTLHNKLLSFEGGTPIRMVIRNGMIVQVEKSAVARFANLKLRFRDPLIFHTRKDGNFLGFYLAHSNSDILIYASTYRPSSVQLPQLKLVTWEEVKWLRKY